MCFFEEKKNIQLQVYQIIIVLLYYILHVHFKSCLTAKIKYLVGSTHFYVCEHQEG